MQVLRRFVTFCRRHLRLLLGGMALLTVGASFVASGLHIDSNLERLLPESAPSVASLERLKTSYGGRIGRLTIVLEGDSVDRLKEVAHDLEPKLSDLEDVDRVQLQRPTSFMWDYRLLYAKYEDLQEAKKRIDRRIKWEKRRAHPLFVDISEEEPPEVDLSDILEGYDGNGSSDYYLNEEGNRLVMFIVPAFPADDLARSTALVNRVRSTVSDHLQSTASEIGHGLTGRFAKRVDLQSLLTADLTKATLIAAVVLFLALLFVLRSVAGLAVVLIPLATAAIWSFAWAEIAFDSLNILTGFLGAILLGIGVDYGIHLYLRYDEFARRYSPTESLVQTLRSSGRANLFAGLTTIVPMIAIATTEFQAYYEFGIIAVGGILFILVAYAVLFPSLMLLVERFDLAYRRPLSSVFVRRVAIGTTSVELGHPDFMRRFTRTIAAILVGLGILSAAGLPYVDFNRDFYVLQSTEAPSWKLDEMVNEMLGQSQTPAVVLTDSPEHSRRVVDEIERRAASRPEGYTIDEAVSLQSVIPDRQDDKLELLRDLQADLRDVPKMGKKGELADYIDEVDTVLQKAPLTIDDLPPDLWKPFQRTEDSEGAVVLVFPAVDLTDMENVEDFVQALSDLPDIEYARGYDALSGSMLLYDIIRYVERDAPKMLAYTLAGLLLISLLAFWRPYDTAVQFLVLTLSVGAATGALGLLGIDFNFLNIVILPIWLGLGIDATFHMLFQLRDHPTDLYPHLTTALAIAAAFLTTMLGFGSTLVAHHEGLHSLGEAAVWGLGAMLAVNLLVYVFLVCRNRAESTAGEASEREEE